MENTISNSSLDAHIRAIPERLIDGSGSLNVQVYLPVGNDTCFVADQLVSVEKEILGQVLINRWGDCVRRIDNKAYRFREHTFHIEKAEDLEGEFESKSKEIEETLDLLWNRKRFASTINLPVPATEEEKVMPGQGH